MDVIEVMRIMVRRWYVTVPLLLATFVASSSAYDRAAPEHNASAVLLFVGPNVDVRYDGEQQFEVAQNPLVNTDGARIASLVTAQLLRSPQVGGALEQAGLDVDYETRTDARNPVLELTTSSETPGHALQATTVLVDNARQLLSVHQDAVGAPPQSRLDFQVLRSSATESLSNTGKLRQAFAVGAVGSVATVVGAAIAEGLARWRRSRNDDASRSSEGVHLEQGHAHENGGRRLVARAGPQTALDDPVRRFGASTESDRLEAGF